AAALRPGPRPVSPLEPLTWLRAVLDLLVELITPTRPAHRSPTSPRGTPAPGVDPRRDRDARAAVDKLTGTGWEVAIRYAVAHPDPRGADPATLRAGLATRAHAIASAFGVHTARNRLRRTRLRHPARVLAGRALRRGFVLSAAELAGIATLPTDLAVPGLTRARAKPAPAPVDVPTGGRGTKTLGRAEVGGHAVALAAADARHHIHLLGATGTGKSTLMCNLILDDVHAHRGVVVIDPKGDLVLDVLDRLPAGVADRVILIDPDQNPGATLNPLAGADHDLVTDNIVAIFSRIFARHWGPRIDDVLRVACLTLQRKPAATLTLVPPLLNDKQFRAPYTVDLDDPEGLRGFWEWYESTPPPVRAQVIGPVLARLRAFLLREFVRRTLGPPRSSFDMRRVLDGGILLARLPKGQIGEDTARLMGSFVLASAWQAATARTRQPQHRRRDACVYIDECHNFLNLPGSVADMLAEARGYGLSLVLAHQDLAQLPRETQLALSANARNKILFNCGPEDAHQLARHTLPELDEHDLSHLDAYTAAARLLVAGRETAAFTLHTNPSRPPLGNAQAIRAALADRSRRSSGDSA
ncbi:MAG: type IV secretion system DNA-binding domain-containing protein, partial [Sporichthyaceae bacterium]|nr:type IV secretion system DNA-binding domain-containing protein [Sporichthyaceae bacterium]